MSGSVILMVSLSVMCICYSDEWVGHSDGQSECDVCVYVTVMSGSVILMVSLSVMCICYSGQWVGHSDGQSECRVYMLQ